MRPYIVMQGDTVASVVRPMGADPATVWNDPKNDSLRAVRSDPAVLCAGDVLYVPDQGPQPLPVSTGATNTFSSPPAAQRVKLVLCGDKPLSNTSYVIHGLGEDISGTTAADGSLSVDVPLDIDTFVLELTDLQVAHQVLVGHLDPTSEDSGIRQRLSNLGYAPPMWEFLPELGIDVDWTLPLMFFQLENGITVSGEVEANTVEALQKAHGT